jgi:hypothetical protein
MFDDVPKTAFFKVCLHFGSILSVEIAGKSFWTNVVSSWKPIDLPVALNEPFKCYARDVRIDPANNS